MKRIERWHGILGIVVLLVGVASAMVFTGHLEAMDALKFFGGPAVALPVGYVIG